MHLIFVGFRRLRSSRCAGAGGYEIPGDPDAWVIAFDNELRTADGQVAGDQQLRGCLDASAEQLKVCLAGKGLYFDVSYQPGSRYWTFQLLEFSAYVALAAALAGLSMWRIHGPFA